MSNRAIKKVAVLGSGIMGSRIACHFANIGVSVLLLDIVPKELSEEEIKKGINETSPIFRNRIVNSSLKTAIASKPSPLYSKSGADYITTGNLTDDLSKISDCDWIIEVVVENLEIKRQLYAEVEKYRKQDTLITTNTSGIPIGLLTKGRTENFKQHFCGSHFFNPPRYLKLLEVIPGKETKKEIIDFLMHYGSRFLGKTTIECLDTPAFIANRIGVYSISSLFHQVDQSDFTINDIDLFTGTIIGRPKSATFRTCDVVGLDTLVHVSNNLAAALPEGNEKRTFELPGFIQQMVNNQWLGDKTKQGFFKKSKDEKGKTIYLSLDLKSLDYQLKPKKKFETIEQVKNIDDLRQRIAMLVQAKDVVGDFYRKSFFGLFEFVASKVNEISPDIFRIDEALEAGFGWELGPFKTWDAIGIEASLKMMESIGFKSPEWVKEMLDAGNKSFYKFEKGSYSYYDPNSKTYQLIPNQASKIALYPLRKEKTIWKNGGCNIIDIGEEVICCEFTTKMNTMGGEVIAGVNKAIELAEQNYKGLVIGNDGANFSAGANLAMIFMMAIEQEYDEIDMAIRMFQNMNMRVRYSSVPVVVAPFGLTLGGGCEMTLHADKVQAHAELYTGLVEFGVGLIPGGGGTKEMALRFADSLKEGDIQLNALRSDFLTIGQAKVSTSAQEAFEMGILKAGRDAITINRNHLLIDARKSVVALSDAGYTQPLQRKNIKVLGKQGLGLIWVGANSMKSGNYISSHDEYISKKLGYVMCGGELSSPSEVTEQYLLDLEREVFLSLTGEKKTLERIQSILTTGKPLRN
ncbi:MAG: 3-hydroxyacyl-CoA dehydrogenase NAD-binding domain-containing protein [Bacteroidota bacterium]